MIVYRLCKSNYAADLSGRGAEKCGGRWNSKGTPVIYTCESRALCTAEIAVHTTLGNIPQDYMMVTLEIPDDLPFCVFETETLPIHWKNFPHSRSTQILGDAYLNEKYLTIKVPSAVVQGDFNFLINPSHQQMNQVKILKTEVFEFDERLFNR